MKTAFIIITLLLSFCCSALAQDATVNKKFLVVQAGAFAAATADAYTTTHNLHAGCVEANPLIGSHPSAGRVYGIALGTTAAGAFVSYELKKHHRKMWLVAPVAGMASHGFAATWNSRQVCR